MNRPRSLAALALLAGLTPLTAQSTPSHALLALSKTDLTLSIVDPATLKVVARMPSGPDPHEVIASSDGRFAYISNYGGGAYNTITVVDLDAQKTLRSVDLGALRGPHGLAYAGGKLWFTAEAAKAIGSLDPAAERVDFVLGTGQDRTHMILVSSDLTRIVTSNVSAATISIIDRRPRAGRGGAGGPPMPPDWNETVVAVGGGSEGFDLSPDGREIWVANAQDGTISIVDVGTRRVTRTLDANVKGANRLKFTPDGKLVFVSALSGAALTVFDASARRAVKRLPIGRGAAGIEIEPDGRRAFVACTPDNYIAVIDILSLDVVGHIDAGRQPDGLAWASR